MSNQLELAQLIQALFQASQQSQRETLEYQLKQLGKPSRMIYILMSNSHLMTSKIKMWYQLLSIVFFQFINQISFIEKNRDQHIHNVVSLLYETDNPEIGKNNFSMSDWL